MIRIPVTTPSRSYEAIIGSGLLAGAGEYLGEILENKRVIVVSVPPVRWRWSKVLLKSLTTSGIPTEVIEMPNGERAKRLSTLEKLAEKLVKQGADRGITLIALRGGVVGDVTGFLASIYMRGVDVIQVPTTVLAQVDAAIGGKTGVNLVSGKNLLGTFHQPRVVLIDTAVLETLPAREYRAGLYETLKCDVRPGPGLIGLFEDRRCEILDRGPVVVERVIADSVGVQASVCGLDEPDGRRRQVLEEGHTIEEC